MARFLRNSFPICPMTTSSKAPITPFLLLSHYATAEIIYAAHLIGLWHDLAAIGDTELNIDAFAREHRLSKHYLQAIVDYLFRVGFVDFTDANHGAVRLSMIGRDFLAEDCLGHFDLLVGAYGHVLHSAADLATGRIAYGADIQRDARLLATASTQIGQSKLHSSYKVVLEHVGPGPVGCVVDIGCGAADFLALVAERTRAASVVGIDVSADACALAEKTLATVAGSSQV